MGIPTPGTQEWENMVDYMRKDLESNMSLTKLEIATRRMFKEQGRDFDNEFNAWKEKRNEVHRDIGTDH